MDILIDYGLIVARPRRPGRLRLRRPIRARADAVHRHRLSRPTFDIELEFKLPATPRVTPTDGSVVRFAQTGRYLTVCLRASEHDRIRAIRLRLSSDADIQLVGLHARDVCTGFRSQS